MAVMLVDVGFQPLDENGSIIPSGFVRINNYGDGSPAISYQDSDATIQNEYKTPLSASGFANIYLAGGVYEIILSDSDDTTVRTISKYTPFEGNNGGTNYGTREEFIATLGQANYTSTDVPIGSVSLHVNGLLLETSLYTVVGNVVTFSPVLDAGDSVVYEYSSEALGGGSVGAGTIWDNATGYAVGTIVSYNGIVYVATSSSTNKRPDLEPTYWAISKGGALWGVGTNYVAGDIVSYGNYIYVALSTSIGQQPDTETAFWKNITLGMVWNSGKNYFIGDIITEGSDIYVSLSANIGKQPSANIADWQNAGSSAIGSVIVAAQSVVPSGYVECNGAAISRTVYASLFSAISTIYGVGDGSTTFNIPDLRGEFIRGWDNSRGIDAGRAIGSYQEDAFKEHRHTYSKSLGGSGIDSYTGGSWGTATQNTSLVGDAAETRPRNIAMMFCIKY